MKHIKIIIGIAAFVLFVIPVLAQHDRTYIDEIEEFRRDKDDRFNDPETSPIQDSDLGQFERLDYYPVDERFRVRAELRAADNEEPANLETARGETVEFIRYGEVDFRIDDNDYTMDVYRKGDLPEMKDQPEELFMPYRDKTSGNETSPYGRYVPVDIPENGSETYIDFNKSSNPYSEYNPGEFDSPLPPQTNSFQQASMMVGERKYEDR